MRARKTRTKATQRLPMGGHHIGGRRDEPGGRGILSRIRTSSSHDVSAPAGGRPMTTHQRYAMPVDPIEWTLPSRFAWLMRWEYEDGRASLLNLYEKGKERQWNGNTRIDWSLDLDPENPQELPDEQISIFGSDIWNRLTKQERANLRRHLQAQQL